MGSISILITQFKAVPKLEKALFFFGLILKILLGATLASQYVTQFFSPFINYYLNSGFSNPYVHFISQGFPQAFPYPALMLYLLAFPQWILGNSDLLVFRLPLLIADGIVFWVLWEWLKPYRKRLLWLYWLNPVLIYISYIHGQLDVIPIALVMLSLRFLFKQKWTLSAIWLGLSICTKTNLLILTPFFLLFLISHEQKPHQIFRYFILTVGTFILINAPFLQDTALLKTVFENHEQSKVFNFSLDYSGGMRVFVVPLCLLLLFIKGAEIKTFNRDVFMVFLSFSFGVLLLFIPPMPGWYYWLVPFLVYFYVRETRRAFWFFWGLMAVYLAYFALIPTSDFLRIIQMSVPYSTLPNSMYEGLLLVHLPADLIANLALTVLQTILVANCLWIYHQGVEKLRHIKLFSRPFLVGVSGNSGSGKTTLADALSAVLNERLTTILHGDDIHKWERGNTHWEEYTHLNPKANELHQDVTFLKQLKSGKPILRRRYDHSSGKFTVPERTIPKALIVYEGLHALYLEQQRQLYDLKIFLSPDFDLAQHWKITRDVEQRGHSLNRVIEQIEKRQPDVDSYIEKQQSYADIIINMAAGTDTDSIQYTINFPNSVFLEPILEVLHKQAQLQITHSYLSPDTQQVVVQGNLSQTIINKIAADYLPQLEELGTIHSLWPENAFGVVVLLILYTVISLTSGE